MGYFIKLLIAEIIGRKIFEIVSLPFAWFLMDLGMDEEDAIKESRDSLRWGFSFIPRSIKNQANCIITICLVFNGSWNG
jgi:hypothetical protein